MNLWILPVIIFFFGVLTFLFGYNPGEIFLNMVARMLTGLVVLYLCNLIFEKLAPKCIVNINEITMLISAILGIPGVIFTYLLHWILTIL